MNEAYPLVLHDRAELIQLLKIAQEFGFVRLTAKAKESDKK